MIDLYISGILDEDLGGDAVIFSIGGESKKVDLFSGQVHFLLEENKTYRLRFEQRAQRSVPQFVENILDVLFKRKRNFSKTVVRGSSEKFNSRNFDLNAKMFTYPIDVKTYRMEYGKKVNYNLQDVVEQFRVGLHKAYEENYDLIVGIANR